MIKEIIKENWLQIIIAFLIPVFGGITSIGTISDKRYVYLDSKEKFLYKFFVASIMMCVSVLHYPLYFSDNDTTLLSALMIYYASLLFVFVLEKLECKNIFFKVIIFFISSLIIGLILYNAKVGKIIICIVGILLFVVQLVLVYVVIKIKEYYENKDEGKYKSKEIDTLIIIISIIVIINILVIFKSNKDIYLYGLFLVLEFYCIWKVNSYFKLVDSYKYFIKIKVYNNKSKVSYYKKYEITETVKTDKAYFLLADDKKGKNKFISIAHEEVALKKYNIVLLHKSEKI